MRVRTRVPLSGQEFRPPPALQICFCKSRCLPCVFFKGAWNVLKGLRKHSDSIFIKAILIIIAIIFIVYFGALSMAPLQVAAT
jgi:hypothetical protein